MFRKNDLIKDHLRERFHVTPKDGSQPFEGVLVGSSKTSFAFADVHFGGFPAASPLFIDRDNISYIQAALPPQSSVVVSDAVG